VVDKIQIEKKGRELEKENCRKIGRWRFQADRSRILDGFERFDLPRLFDER